MDFSCVHLPSMNEIWEKFISKQQEITICTYTEKDIITENTFNMDSVDHSRLIVTDI